MAVGDGGRAPGSRRSRRRGRSRQIAGAISSRRRLTRPNRPTPVTGGARGRQPHARSRRSGKLGRARHVTARQGAGGGASGVERVAGDGRDAVRAQFELHDACQGGIRAGAHRHGARGPRGRGLQGRGRERVVSRGSGAPRADSGSARRDALPRIRPTRSGSAKEKGPGASGPGRAGNGITRAAAAIGTAIQGFRSSACQQTKETRPPERSVRTRFVKA